MSSQTNVGDDAWHHLAFTYDMAIAKLYIDGVVEFEQELSETPQDNDAPIRIGAVIDALVDELQILNVALTEQEVNSNMVNGIETGASAIEPANSLNATWGSIKNGY